MKRIALASIVVSGLAVFSGYGSASTAGHWVMTDVAAQAQHEFPHYTGVAFVGMTAGGRVVWTTQRRGGAQLDREVFQWQNGRITDLGPLPKHTLPLGFNGGGAIVGSSEDPPYCGYGSYGCTPGPGHAYLWQPEKTTFLGTLGGPSSGAWAINDRGQVVGDSQTPSGKQHAVLWQHGRLTDLGEGSAWAINDRGQVLEDVTSKNTEETVIWDHGKTTPVMSSGYCQPRAFSNVGQVIGQCTKPNQPTRAFVWQNGKTTDLGLSFDGYPMAVNDHGDVVEPEQPWSNESRGILWRNGKKLDLGSLGGPVTFPIALNDRDQVVGISTLRGSTFENPDTRAFLWQNGKIQALPSDGAILDYGAPMSINTAGTLIAGGTEPLTCRIDSCAGELYVWQYRR